MRAFTLSIGSAFSTVRLRTKVARGAGFRTAAPAMACKLVESAQARWRAVNAPWGRWLPRGSECWSAVLHCGPVLRLTSRELEVIPSLS